MCTTEGLRYNSICNFQFAQFSRCNLQFFSSLGSSFRTLPQDCSTRLWTGNIKHSIFKHE
uniref:Uncharacterized protein n=1 Tax=Medicago truncatula TaxID=3880 RepID=I3S3H2_MEDTR|nr:unknown [Medicago truncatula]